MTAKVLTRRDPIARRGIQATKLEGLHRRSSGALQRTVGGIKVDDSDVRGFDGRDLIVVRLADHRDAGKVLVKTDLFPA